MTAISVAKVVEDPAVSARVAGLRYVIDTAPGIGRVSQGKGFRYVDPKGRVVRAADTLGRIRRLVIPPAWTDVWICPLENGHIQATGRDARGRKQYRYHPRWQEFRNATKFHRMVLFGKALPRTRRKLRRDLRLTGLPREKVVATVIALLEMTLIRIGNEAYAQENNSFGLTTMRDRHVDVSGSTIRFRFRGKSGKEHEVQVMNRHLAKTVRECQDLPGQELFQYIDEDGEQRTISSEDVNAYLREVSGQDFTAKDFRTWAGTVLFVDAIRRLDPCRSVAHAKRQAAEIIRRVAAQLRNTPTVCRNYYIHPYVLERFLDNSLHGIIDKVCEHERKNHSLPTESLVMRLLKQAAREAA